MRKFAEQITIKSVVEPTPGTKVTLVGGTFVGKAGVVVSRAKAELDWQAVGGERLHKMISRTDVWVSLSIFNRQIPICLEVSQLEVLYDQLPIYKRGLPGRV
jgi:transcription antitermination factor NusG